MAEDNDVIDPQEDVEKPGEPYVDLSDGKFPRLDYIGLPSTNLSSRGIKKNELIFGGSTTDLNLDLEDLIPSEYPYNQVRETITGHVTEIDDTPGRERMLFKHATGSGVDMRPDGTVIINTRYNRIEITGNDQKVIVQGDGEIFYHGNLKLNVSGDMDVEVGGNYNLKVHGDKREDIRGSYQQKVRENHETTITENKSTFVNGTATSTVLGDSYNIVKQTYKTLAQDINQFAGRDTLITSKEELSISTDNANIAARDMVVQSTTGMIGGDNVIYYGKNYYGTSATFTDGVTAPAFHGDLQGTAVQAITADVTNSQNYSAASTGSASGYTADNTATDTGIRASFPAPGPDANWLSEYLTQSGYGYRIVDVDVGSVIADEIDRRNVYGGVSKVRLTTREVRSKLRDPNTSRNATFIGRAQAEGILSASYIDQKPTGYEIGRIANTEGTPKVIRGQTFPGGDPTEKVQYTNNLQKTITLTPAQLYNPEQQLIRDGEITAKTALAPGIKLARFLGGHGDPQTLNSFTDEIQRVRIAKNLYLHANFMNSVQDYLDETNRYSLQVVEGFYVPEEQLETDSLNFKMSRGQCVVYELRDRNGLIPIEKTYELAVHIKDFFNFEKMILDYDTYDPSGELNVQIIMVMPEVTPQWTVAYDNKIETRYNNYVQTNGELIELL